MTCVHACPPCLVRGAVPESSACPWGVACGDWRGPLCGCGKVASVSHSASTPPGGFIRSPLSLRCWQREIQVCRTGQGPAAGALASHFVDTGGTRVGFLSTWRDVGAGPSEEASHCICTPAVPRRPLLCRGRPLLAGSSQPGRCRRGVRDAGRSFAFVPLLASVSSSWPWMVF